MVLPRMLFLTLQPSATSVISAIHTRKVVAELAVCARARPLAVMVRPSVMESRKQGFLDAVVDGWCQCAGVCWKPSINAAQIGAEVTDGIVTLAGHVGSYGEKWGAERAVQRVAGVRGLAVEIDVTLPGSAVRSADVVLSGVVHCWAERELARHSAWGTPGLRTVVDNMTVTF